EYHSLDQVNPNWKTFLLFPLDKILRTRNFAILKRKFVDKDERLNGLDWPANAKTMIGYNRLTNIENCIETIVEDSIEGDFIETGVWRGGSTMFMKAVLNDYEIDNRTIWLADSFQGVPPPNPQYPADKNSKLHKQKILKISKEQVENNFKLFDLFDDNIKFIEGWFNETLPLAPVEKLALLRLDGDLYESTFLALNYLYPKLSVGGFVIIDDFNAFEFCKKAVIEFREINQINDEITEIDKEAI